ncbi:RNA polymerase sigma factor [Nesterenkonia sandarakina]|uniref:RNA polymerase sigma factor n=1 Tax=Nesterenkonia sandarakina TaxID=272918 RepID=UPI003380EB92
MGPPSETTDHDRTRLGTAGAADPAQNEEGNLVLRARDGDLLAFAILLEAHEPLIFELCLWILHHEAETKLVVDEILLTAWRRLDSLRDAEDFSSWLFWIAAHHSHFVLRGRPPRSPQPDSSATVVGPRRAPEAAFSTHRR